MKKEGGKKKIAKLTNKDFKMIKKKWFLKCNMIIDTRCFGGTVNIE